MRIIQRHCRFTGSVLCISPGLFSNIVVFVPELTLRGYRNKMYVYRGSQNNLPGTGISLTDKAGTQGSFNSDKQQVIDEVMPWFSTARGLLQQVAGDLDDLYTILSPANEGTLPDKDTKQTHTSIVVTFSQASIQIVKAVEKLTQDREVLWKGEPASVFGQLLALSGLDPLKKYPQRTIHVVNTIAPPGGILSVILIQLTQFDEHMQLRMNQFSPPYGPLAPGEETATTVQDPSKQAQFLAHEVRGCLATLDDCMKRLKIIPERGQGGTSSSRRATPQPRGSKPRDVTGRPR